MTIRTVQISEHITAQGEAITCPCTTPLSSECECWRSPATGRATVRTGPTTTATGRIIERKRDE